MKVLWRVQLIKKAVTFKVIKKEWEVTAQRPVRVCLCLYVSVCMCVCVCVCACVC